MGWTVTKEDSDGKTENTLTGEFRLSNTEIIFNGHFRILKYLDPFDDTTFNSLMIKDLVLDLEELKTYLPIDTNRIDEVIEFAKSCLIESHTFIKFYGD